MEREQDSAGLTLLQGDQPYRCPQRGDVGRALEKGEQIP